MNFDDLSEPAAFRRARLARLQEEADRRRAIEEEQERAVAARVSARTIEYHKRHVMAEYLRAGVKPPYVDGAGNPTISLSLLLARGFRIESYVGQNVLVAPADPAPSPSGRTREDYQNVDGS